MERTSEEPLIREMVEGDLPEVIRIERLSFSVPWSRDAFLFELRNSAAGRRLLVAEHQGRIAGYIVYWAVEREGEILDVAVAPDVRRKGIGRHLVREAINDLERLAVESIHLEIRPSNRGALGLYRAYGFETSYVRRDYYDKPREDALVLRLDLGR